MGKEVYDKWNAAGKDDQEMMAIQAHKQIKEILNNIKTDIHGRSESETKKLRETQKTLKSYVKTLTMKMMDLDDDE
jgi:hypothetical protein